ncbi:MAG: hypothetical protein P4L75_07845 [Clostridia bacterium]|nr:hypothetical protein [Clostridia bacterium]
MIEKASCGEMTAEMKTNYALFLCVCAAFVLAAIALFTAGAKGVVTPAEGGLFAAVAAVVILLIRVIEDEKRIDALERRLFSTEDPDDAGETDDSEEFDDDSDASDETEDPEDSEEGEI